MPRFVCQQRWGTLSSCSVHVFFRYFQVVCQQVILRKGFNVNMTVRTKRGCYCSKASWCQGMERSFIAHAEITLLRCFGNESHFEQKNHGFTGFYRFDKWLFQKTSVPIARQNVLFHVWTCLYTLPMDLTINLSAVHLLYSLMGSNNKVLHAHIQIHRLMTYLQTAD